MMRVMHVEIHCHIFDRRLIDATIEMIESWLVREMLRWKRWLLVHVERIEVREWLLHGLMQVRIEPVECSALMTGIHGAFRGGK